MRTMLLIGLMVPLLAGMAGGQAATKPVEPAEALKHAAGASLAEVTAITERDHRPMDGHLEVEVTLQTVKRSGLTRDAIHIVKAYGGLSPPGVPDPPPDPLRHIPFEKGKRYWFVWASPHEQHLYGHQLIGWWPADAPQGRAVEQAIAKDRFASVPSREPVTGVTYERHFDPAEKVWTLLGKRDGKVLWERKLQGKPIDEAYMAWGVYRARNVEVLAEGRLPNDTRYLSVATDKTLPPDNPYQVPAGDYRQINWYDLQTGWCAAVEVHSAADAPSQIEWLVRRFKQGGEQPVWQRERRYKTSGGKQVGASTDAWLMQVVTTFDPDTGNRTSRTFYRIDGSKPVEIDGKGLSLGER